MPDIRVDLRNSAVGFGDAWRDLVRRAAPNVFLAPAALNAVAETSFARMHVLLAWDAGAKPEKLVGVWALGEGRATPLGPAFLTAPVHNYAFLASPVVDAALLDETIAAFFARIAAEPALPKLIRLKYLDGEAATYRPILAALAARNSQVRVLADRGRAFATRAAGLKRGGSTRKKLRQDWNRLTRLGAAEIVNEPAPEAVMAAFEAFLALEAASWKGESGTALLARPVDAAFARRMIGNLAAEGMASVAILRLDGRPIAAQVLLYCGTTAYTWKTAFDAAFARHSPGALLVDQIADQLFSADIEAIESCSPEGGFMARMWDGRQATVDLLAHVGARRSLGFAVASLRESGIAELKRLRDRLRERRAAAVAAAARQA